LVGAVIYIVLHAFVQLLPFKTYGVEGIVFALLIFFVARKFNPNIFSVLRYPVGIEKKHYVGLAFVFILASRPDVFRLQIGAGAIVASLLIAVIGGLLSATLNELVRRAVILSALTRRLGERNALVISSAIFALSTLIVSGSSLMQREVEHPLMYALPFLMVALRFALEWFYGRIFLNTGSIWPSVFFSTCIFVSTEMGKLIGRSVVFPPY
jgi:membrane protease YdiL (CAAX protease family)